MNVLISDTDLFVRDIAESVEEGNIKVDGFIELYDGSKCTEGYVKKLGKPIFWWEDVAKYAQSHVVIHGDNRISRADTVAKLEVLGMRFATYVHPTAIVPKSVKFGRGCYVAAGAIVGSDCVIGNHVFLQRGCILGHDVTVGDYSSVAPAAKLAGGSTVGHHTFVAIQAGIIDNKSVGNYCIVGAGAIVVKDFGNNLKLMGVPARIAQKNIRGR